MADIAMCTGKGCKFRSNCYRFTAPKGMRQSYFLDVPIKNSKCLHFWDNKQYNNENKY